MLCAITIDVHHRVHVNHGYRRGRAVARVRELAYEMWLAASRSQSELGDQHNPRPCLYVTGRSAPVQPAERAAPGLRRHEGREPATSDGAGNATRPSH